MTFTRLYTGDSSRWKAEDGELPDVVFSTIYGPLPKELHHLPMIINIYHPVGHSWKERWTERREWCGGESEFEVISCWGGDLRNTVYSYNLPKRMRRLNALKEDLSAVSFNTGWFPVRLPLEVMDLYSDIFKPGVTVWDGFCGRGTVGKACQMLDLNFIGVEIDPVHMREAQAFLGVENAQPV